MKHLKSLGVAVLFCISTTVCESSHADMMKLVSTSGNTVGDVEVYPYNLSLNGSTTTSPMMCINYDDHVTVGESWQVTSTQVTTASSLALQEDAWIFSQAGKGSYNDADIQFAVWSILDPAVTSTAGFDSNAQQLVLAAQGALSSLTNSFLSQYTEYSPVTTSAAQATWTDGLPQSFIAADPIAVTPEPSTLLLLGTGLLSASMLLMRRNALQGQMGRRN